VTAKARDAVAATRLAVIVPARYGSTRLPGKPLRELLGKPLVLWVYEQARMTGADFVAVATDDERIARVVEAHGGEVVLTRADHASGTDRLAEVAARAGFGDETIVVNLQGDEPLVAPELVRDLALALSSSSADIATVATPLDPTHGANPNVVKVVTDKDGFALYFSRHAIPFGRGTPDGGAPGATSVGLRHLGLYAYRTATLRALAAHPPVHLEQLESLEQLRALWMGYRILVHQVAVAPAHGVDTEEDVERVEAELRARGFGR
jgi:3-deoxy-manno-octulosonate cytidylyltransferase (CMP-KDO synthetase)